MSERTRRHTPRYDRGTHGTGDDYRLDSGVFHRNAPPIIAALGKYLLNRSGPVLEIGAGTGQHAAAFQLAFPALEWVASDPFPEHIASIAGWARHLLRRETQPLQIDAATDWWQHGSVRSLGPLTAVYAGNVTHITPWQVTEGILAGAGRCLAITGRLFLYGPFKDGAEFFGDGNRRFDRDLRADDPAWGLRDIGQLREAAGIHGIQFETALPMPANNHLLVFHRP